MAEGVNDIEGREVALGIAPMERPVAGRREGEPPNGRIERRDPDAGHPITVVPFGKRVREHPVDLVDVGGVEPERPPNSVRLRHQEAPGVQTAHHGPWRCLARYRSRFG